MRIEAEEFKQALPVLQAIEAEGYRAYFVGGCIRDVLLHLPIHDVDIATSAYPSEVQHIFPKHFDVGIEHGTVMVCFEGETYEITTFRTEADYEDFRRPSEVTFVRSLSEDLLRRDFTINAMAMGADGQIVDYFQGKEDLQAKRLRAVGVPKERFHEDALRMMRAVRFASQLDFHIEEQTKSAIKSCAPLLKHIAVERIETEMNKLWIGKNWKQGIREWLDLDLYQYCPQTAALYDTFEKLLENLSGQVKMPDECLPWALLYFLNGQEERTLGQFIRAWKLSNKQYEKIKSYLKALHERAASPNGWTKEMVYRYGKEVSTCLEQFIHNQAEKGQKFADVFSAISSDQVDKVWTELAIHSRKELAVNGYDIMKELQPEDKKQIGYLILRAEEAVVKGQCENDRKKLLNYLKK